MRVLRRACRGKPSRPWCSQLQIESLEERWLLSSGPTWPVMAHDPQHSGLSSSAANPLETIRWQTPVDLAPQLAANQLLIHYGEPLFGAANTVIVPVKTGASDGFRIDAHNGATGAVLWTQPTDYTLPPHGWTPSYSPALTPDNRLVFAGAGGTIDFRSNVDQSTGTTQQIAFYGLSNYQADPAAFNATVFVDTPITTDSAGDVYFGVRVTGANPLGLQSGVARIDPSGNATFTTATAAAGNDSMIGEVPLNCAPALSPDGKTLYIVVRSPTTELFADLVGLDSTTLAPKYKVHLFDPRSGNSADAGVPDNSSASPMVGPDGDVYFGVMGNPFNGSRGWMLHFSSDLRVEKTPGAFGWDDTPSVVPVSMVPSYKGSSSYLLFTKYNDYAGTDLADSGNGVNKIAILDPNATQVESHASSNGLLVMREVLTLTGPTPDQDVINQGFPQAVREWCINSAVVDRFTHSIFANSEDGKLYRWNLNTNSISQAVTLTPGLGEAYTPTAIGPDGTIYAINNATLFAVGLPTLTISDAGTFSGSDQVPLGFTLTLSGPAQDPVTVNYATADGTAKAGAGDYQPASGTVTFAPGQTSQTITVSINGSTTPQPNKNLVVNLSGAVNAVAIRLRAIGTILNDVPAPLSNSGWTPLGPASANGGELFSGRITGVATDPNNVNVIYIAAASGGVWKTINGGISWIPLTDNQVTLYMGAIAVAPSNANVIYAGTGEANLGPSKTSIARDNIYYGEGVLKSINGGSNWVLTGSAEFYRRTISRIVVDPTDANTVYVAVGALATNGLPGNTGIWKSTNGGGSWLLTTKSISTTAPFSDVVIDPANPQVLFAAVGDPNGNTANGVYVTTDGGASWARAGNFPSGASDSNLGRITLALSAADPMTLYASVAHDGPMASLFRMMKSTDGGQTWSQLTGTPNYLGSFGDYDTSLAVDPTNANVIYAGGTANSGIPDFIESRDGGTTWQDIEFGVNGVFLHGDEHSIAFDRLGRLFAVDDGGIFRLDDPNPTAPVWTDLNSNLNTIQFMGITLDPTNPSIAYGGNQDNGVVKTTGNLVWPLVDGGDGGNTAVNFINPTQIYHDGPVASYGPMIFVQRSDDGGGSWTPITTGISADSEPTVFNPPLIMDPNNPDRLFVATNRVYETTSDGDPWTPISLPGVGGWTVSTAINALALSASDPNTLYAATANHIFVTFDDGLDWKQIDVPGVKDHIQALIVDPRDNRIAYAVRDRFGPGHVFRTTNGGQSWTDISGNLPETPVNAVALDPRTNLLYVGTDQGVYVSADSDGNWTIPAGRMPRVKVVQFDLDTGLNILAAATHGRGAWELDITPAVTQFKVISPASTPAGTPFQLTVQAVDASGNVVTNFRGTIHIMAGDPGVGVVVPTDYTFTAADSGQHVFNVTLVTAGDQFVSVSNTGDSDVAGTATIHVTPLVVTSLVVGGFLSPATAGVPTDFIVMAQDQFGNVATTYVGTVTFSSNDPQALLPAIYTFVPGDHGVHSFTAVLKTAGDRSITATDTITASITGTQSHIAVTAAAVSTLQVSGFTSPTTAGVPGSFRVIATDMFGNRVTGYLGTVHFTSSDVQAVLPDDYTFIASDNGAHTFNAKLLTAGIQTIRATDTTSSSVTGSQTAITVNPAAAVTLAVTGFPSTIASGTAANVTVTALDSFGNVAQGYRGTVRLSSSDSAATLPANFSFTSSSAGTHTFTVTLVTKGTQSITATDTVSGSVTGTESGITVAAAPVPVEENDDCDWPELQPASDLPSHQQATDIIMAGLGLGDLRGPTDRQEQILAISNAPDFQALLSLVAVFWLSALSDDGRSRARKVHRPVPKLY